jgi:hypothetical protein
MTSGFVKPAFTYTGFVPESGKHAPQTSAVCFVSSFIAEKVA